MATTKEKEKSTSNWNEFYPKVVRQIAEKDSSTEQFVKEHYFEEFKKVLKGKELILENSCKSR